MDNRLFNVNGKGDESLLLSLKSVFRQRSDFREETCVGWYQSLTKGLMLCWCEGDNINNFPVPISPSDCLPFVTKWLETDFAKGVKLGEWCGDKYHDGHNTRGWQVYIEDWGNVGDDYKVICAIRPAYLWHGK